MLRRFASRVGFCLGCFMKILTVFATIGLSWLTACGLCHLVTLCAGWTFTWLLGTGVWVFMLLLIGIFAPMISCVD